MVFDVGYALINRTIEPQLQECFKAVSTMDVFSDSSFRGCFLPSEGQEEVLLVKAAFQL